MATTTSKLGLTKPDLTDLVDVTVLNTDFDKIDTASGITVCTSTTRPATPWNGQPILETDTNNVYIYKTATTTWVPVGGAIVSTTKPATAGSGNFWLDPDTMRVYIYYVDANSSQWVEVGGGGSASLAVAANATVRDTMFPTPQQGNMVYRFDLGLTQTYYAAYNVSTNPGGRDTAGWYDTEKNRGLIAIRPTVVTAVGGGTATANAVGQVSFSGCTDIYITIPVTGFVHHRVVFTQTASTGTDVQTTFQVTTGGVAQTGYYYTGYNVVSNGGISANNNSNSSYVFMCYSSPNSSNSSFIDISKLEINTGTNFQVTSNGWVSGGNTYARTCIGTSPVGINDGVRFGISGGTMGGFISIYGYND